MRPDGEQTPSSSHSAADNPSGGKHTPTNTVAGCTDQRTASDFLDRTLGVWQQYSSKELTREDARQITANISSFFKVLAGWAAAEPRDAMYEDKLAGRIGNEFFDAKAAEFRAEQARLMRDLEAHQQGNRNYIEESVQLLELAHRAHVLFESQPPTEKRRLLSFVLSNCIWKGGELTAKYRQPFDVLEVAVASEQQRMGGEKFESTKFRSLRFSAGG